jgi:pyruvate kinase
MPRSRAQIVATLGPSSDKAEIVRAMALNGMDVVRLNFSWGDFAEHTEQIKHAREAEKSLKISLIIMGDLPGPRIQKGKIHTYDHSEVSALTDHDRECIAFGIEQKVDCFALSFVGNAADIESCRKAIAEKGGKQPIIAKIERTAALEHLDAIIAAADAVMVARGDLGEEVPIERIPFIQADIIRRANAAGKPVITATQMMLSMTESPSPTRAEVTDVANAILQGSDAVMLSDETANGKYPTEAVKMMERITIEAEKHLSGGKRISIDHAGARAFNLLKKL